LPLLSACGAKSSLLTPDKTYVEEPTCAAAAAACSGAADCCNGLCIAGLCASPSRRCAPGEGVTALASSDTTNDILSLTIDADFVYWSTNNNQDDTGKVYRVSKGGGSVTELAQGTSPYAIAVANGRVYWAEGQGLSSFPVEGGPKTILASLGLFSESVAVDKDNAYVGTAAGSLHRIPVAGGSATVLVPPVPQDCCFGVLSVALDAEHAWMTRDTSLIRVSKATGDLLTVAASENFFGSMRVDGTTAYWSDSSIPSTIFSTPRDGGAVTTLAVATSTSVIAIDADTLYWSDNQPELISKIPKSGGAPIVVAKAAPAFFTNLAVDDSCVYWGDSEGIHRAPK
jgi:hypothetical protein